MPKKTQKPPKYTGPISKYGWPLKIVSVTHGSVVLSAKSGEQSIVVTRDGNLNSGKRQLVKTTYASAVNRGKAIALKMGENAVLFTHGASENTIDYQVRNGKLVRVG